MWKRKVVLEVYSTKDTFKAVFSEHRIDFAMVSALGNYADELRIDIYNLDSGIVGKLAQLEDKEFTLYAGYEDAEALEIVMIGHIVNVWGRKQLPHHITTLWCVPLSAARNSKKAIPETYGEKTLEQLIDALVVKAGYPSGSTTYAGFNKEGDERLETKIPTTTTTGTMLQELDILGEEYNFRFQCANSFVKIISNTISNLTVELMNEDVKGVKIHKIRAEDIKGTPELKVAFTDITVNLNATINCGDVLDYTLLGVSTSNFESIFGVQSENKVLYRGETMLNHIVRDKYQIVSLTHTGSNYAPVWDTTISATNFNKYVTVGDEQAQEAAGVSGWKSMIPSIEFDNEGRMVINLPADTGYNPPTSGTPFKLEEAQRRAKNAMGVKLSAEQDAYIYSVTGMDEQKRDAIVTALKIESQGQGKIRSDLVSNKGATGPGQFMPATAKAFGITDRTDFKQTVQAMSKYVDHMRDRLGSGYTNEKFLADYNGGPDDSSKVGIDEANMDSEARMYLEAARAMQEQGG